MEQMTLTQAVNAIGQVLAHLENAKEECKDMIDATLDAYFGEIAFSSKEEFKAAKAARRTEAKNIKKLAKAMMKGEKEAAKEEADNMASLIDSLG